MLLFYLYISLLVFATADYQELEKLILALRAEETEVSHVFKGPFSYKRGQILNAPNEFCLDPMYYCKSKWFCRGDWCEKEGGKFSTCVPKSMIREFMAAPHQPTGGTCAPGSNDFKNLAIETAWFASAAYDEFNVGVEQYERYGWKFLFDAHDVDSAARAVIWEKSNACLVAFRGTQEKINWMKNLDVGRARQSDGSFAHKGFYEHTIETLRAGLEMFFQQTSKCSMKKIILTGHSLGGACAILFTNMLLSGAQNLKMREPKDVQTFTYGQPRAFFKCPAKIHDDQRIHRFFLKNNFGITDVVPTGFANIGATFCTKGLVIAWEGWEHCCKAGWVETMTDNVPVLGLGSLLPREGVNLHSMKKYFQTVNENGYDYNCETSYE